MGNCIVEKLKGEVENTNLKVFSAIEFYVSAGKTCMFSLGGAPTATKITVIGDGDLKDNNNVSYGKTYTHTGGSWTGPTQVVATGKCTVYLEKQKYVFDFLTLNTAEVEGDMLIYNTLSTRTLHSLNITNCTFIGGLDVSKLQQYSTTVFLPNNSGVYGKFDNNLSIKMICNKAEEPLLNAAALERRSDIKCVSVPLAGDIKYLGYTSVGWINGQNNGSLYLHGVNGQITNNTWTTGIIENLVTCFINNGRTSGKIQLEHPIRFKNVYYNNMSLYEYFSQAGAPVSSANTTLTWDSQGNVTWGTV